MILSLLFEKKTKQFRAIFYGSLTELKGTFQMDPAEIRLIP